MFTITRPKLVICDADVHATVVEALRRIDDAVAVPVYTVDRRLEGVQCADDLVTADGLDEVQEANFV